MLPIYGFWNLARRVVHVRNRFALDANLGIVRMTEPPSEKWFATAERLRQEDVRRYFGSRAAKARGAVSE